jgi:MYXO-CTERM domain-containing protein
VVEYRVVVGVLGLLILGGFLLWRRRPDRQDPRYLGVLPDGFSATVAASLYGVAAGVLALLSLDAFLVAGGDGTGQWLSAAIVASAMAVVYGVSLYRTVLTRARLGAATFPLDQAARPSS